MAPNDPEALLDEARWLQRMARGLVGDEHTAADLAQEAWLAAQTQPAAIRGERRAWLVGTLQRLVARTFRSRGRRNRREDLAARRGQAPSAAELTARAEVHQQLLQHLQALAEPYRVVLMLRYYDELPPRAIARQLDLPVRTVQTRLARGLQQLRERLDSEHPRGRAGWVALLCLPRPQALWPAPTTVTATIAALTVAAATTFLLWPRALDDRLTSAPTAAPSAATTSEPAPIESTRIATSTAPPTPAATGLTGTVVDWHGYPIANAQITVAEHLGLRWPDASGEPELIAGTRRTLPAPTDRAGTFAWEPSTAAVELRAEASSWLTVLVPIHHPDAPQLPPIVMAPATPLQGQVVDEQGHGIAAAALQVALVADFDALQQRGTEGQHALQWTARTDAAGRFTFAAVPDIDAVQLTIQCAGYEPLRQALRDCTRPLVLQRWREVVTGRLLDGAGQPLAAATVASHHCVVTTDADGNYTVQARSADALFAVARGLQPTRLPPTLPGQPQVLAAPARQFEGVLRWADGSPIGNGIVSLVDATVLGAANAPCVLEAIAADDHRVLHLTNADALGVFRLTGLADRPYRLRVVDPTSAAFFETGPLLPGRVEVTAPAAMTRAEHTVQLRATDGQPLVGASVVVQSAGYLLRRPGLPEHDVIFTAGSSGTTDADGRVTLHQVPRHGAHLRIRHPATGHSNLALADQPESLHVLVPTGEVIVRLAAARGDEWLELLDARGSAVPLHCLTGISMRTELRWPLLRGNSPVLQVPGNAVQARIGSPRGHVDLPLQVRAGERVAIDG